MRLINFIFSAITLTVSVAATAQALDPASRAVLRRETLIQRGAIAESADGNASLKALARPKNDRTAASAGIPALIRLNDGATAESIEGEGVEILGQRHGFVFATVTPEAACRLDLDPSISRMELNRHREMKMDMVRRATGIDRVHQGIDLPQAYTGKGVVCGVVDAGFDPNHPNFLNEDGSSRFAYFAQVMANSTGSIIVNRQDPANMSKFTTDDRTTYHGSHTTGIMAGSYRGNATVAQVTEFPFTENVETECPYYGIAYQAEIAASTGMSYDAFIAYALDGILAWRWEERHYNPVVINMSIGGNQGPHDGSSAICQFLDVCAEQDGAIICLSAGNEGDMPLAINKQFTDDDFTLSTGISPLVYGPEYGNIRYGMIELYSDDDTPFEMQAVIYNKSRGRVACRMPMSSKVGSSIQYWVSGAEYQESSEDIIDSNFARAFEGYVGVVPTVDPVTGRFYAVVDAYTKDNPLTNANGNYVLGIEITGKAGQRINGYSDGQFVGFASLDVEGWADGTTDGTISDVACGQNTICVGSSDVRNYYPAMDGTCYQYPMFTPGDYTFYSSYATMPDGSSLPHLCAPGATVISSGSTPYINNADNMMPESYAQAKISGEKRDSYYMQMHGTSMATPVVAGTVALMLEANPDLTYAQVREILMETAVKDSYLDNLAEPARAGAGKLDSYAAVKRAAEMVGVLNIRSDGNASRPMVRQTGGRQLQISLPGADGIIASLFDVSGRRVADASNSGSDLDLNASSLSPGVYILKVNGTQALRILIK